jgi:hypothetical protein
MAWEDMELRGPEERRASKLHIPRGLSRGPLKFTVPEDEFRVAAIGWVALCAVVGRKDRCQHSLAVQA